jgi:hypothetical protein
LKAATSILFFQFPLFICSDTGRRKAKAAEALGLHGLPMPFSHLWGHSLDNFGLWFFKSGKKRFSKKLSNSGLL